MLKDLIPIQQLPLLPNDWNYDKSIEEINHLLHQWKGITLEIAIKLYVARKTLSTPAWNKRTMGQSVPSQTWDNYCKSTDLSKRTANRWLAMIFGPVRLSPPSLPKLKSQVLYADPPWSFSNTGFDQSANQKYTTLSLKEICDYTDKDGKTIRQLANEKRSVLFLWVPAALLPEGLAVVNAWRFQYKTQMVWSKDKSPGMGWWVNSKHELLFIASKGEKLHPAIKYDSVFEAPVSKHSQKPEQVYEIIESMYTGPYIELFARQPRKGWSSWGDEL